MLKILAVALYVIVIFVDFFGCLFNKKIEPFEVIIRLFMVIVTIFIVYAIY